MESDASGTPAAYSRLSETAQKHVEEAITRAVEYLIGRGIDLDTESGGETVIEAIAAWIVASGNRRWLAITPEMVRKAIAKMEAEASIELMEWWRLPYHDPNVYVAGHYAVPGSADDAECDVDNEDS